MRFPFLVLGVWCMVLALTTGPAAQATPLEEAAARFKLYALDQIDQSLAGAEALRDAVAKGDLPKAQAAWLAARGGWERSEVITDEFFPDLDEAIDGWPNAKAGFHAIEAKLFGAHQMDVAPLADALIARLMEFDQKLRAISLSPQGLLNGTTKLVYEIGENKADGGESQFSGNSLADMSYNLAGVEAAYRMIFAPMLEAGDHALASSIQGKIEQLKELLNVPTLKGLDPAKLRATSEDLALALQSAASALGLQKPGLEN